ncbi:MAG: SpoIIE family protein phosphatase, partial [Anaerovoracaceae bacterium]
ENIGLGKTASEDSKEALEQQAEDYLVRIAEKQAIASNEKLLQVSATVKEAVNYMDLLYSNPSNFRGSTVPKIEASEDSVASGKYMLSLGVENSRAIQQEVRLLSNCAYMFAPFLNNNNMLSKVYVGTESGIYYRYASSHSYDANFDPRNRGWYQKAMENPDTVIWLDTYEDYYGKTCVTSAMTFRDAAGRIMGVVAVDIALEDMLKEITSVTIGESGYAFLLDDRLQYIAHPDFVEDSFEKDATLGRDEDTLQAFKTIQENQSGIVQMNLDRKESYVAFSTLGETNWKLCISIDRKEVIGPALATKTEIDQMTSEAQKITQSAVSSIIIGLILLFIVVGILVIVISIAVSKNITRPIQRLASKVADIGDGNFDMEVKVESEDEVGQLAKSFNTMLKDLKVYVQDLTEVTAEKERIGTELGVATQIKANMLPGIFPAFPDRPEIDIYGTMTPAKEVGGDFYDFFLIDDDHLALVMADVSGKGVPAALFMVITKTLLKNTAQGGLSPKEVLEKVNNQLCIGNEAEMFVTVWLGILEISTGKMVCSNAGHEYPVIKRAGEEYQLLKDKHGFVLAGMEGSRYHEYLLQLNPGDKVFLYTD